MNFVIDNEGTLINVEDCEIPKSITSIGEYAFLSCTNLNGVNIPETCKVAENAFNNI